MMRPHLPYLLFAGLTCVLAMSSTAVPAGQQAGGQSFLAGTGFIAGQVIDVPSGKPVPEAVVALYNRGLASNMAARGGDPNQNIVVAADGQGRFFFGSLPIGQVIISVSKTGYL